MSSILVSQAAGVLTITLNRPEKLNAFNPEMHSLLRQAIERAADQADIRAVLLTGSGRGFCAGQDLAERDVSPGAAPIDLSVSIGSYYNPLVRRLRELPKPVVCAVNGIAAGAGANVVLACDLVLAARSASFVQSFARLGLVPDSGGTYFLPRLVGTARAMGLALLGEKLSAEDAERWGLIWKALDDDKLPAEANALARALASGPTKGYGLVKRAIYASAGNSLEAQLDLERDLRETYPFGMFAVPMDRIVRIHASSGTTGKPTVVGYSAKDIDTWAGVMARSIRAAGARPGDKVHVAYGYGLFTGGLGAHYGAERLGLAVIPLGGGMTERQVQLIEDFKPDIIMVTPSYMLAIADEMERQGLDPRRSSLRIGIFGAEPWTNEMRANIENRLSMEAFDLYGLSEVIGPGVAQECAEAKDGLTIWEDHFYPEVVDAASGKPLADGEKGELILTSLTKEALPVIRYRTRDLTRLLPGTARAMRRMEKVTGRSDDMLIIRGVNLFPSQIEELILRQPGLSPHYALEISRDGPLDHLTVLVEGNDTAMASLQHSIKAYIGITVDVRAGSIERSIGKAKRVIDKRPR